MKARTVLQNNIETSQSNFFYDLCEGYLAPEDILDTPHDVEEVVMAVRTLQTFKNVCEQRGLIKPWKR